MMKTATDRNTLEWRRVGGAHAGINAEYGDWHFRVYAWQPGSYLAGGVNRSTGDGFEHGMKRGEIKTQREGRALCETFFRQLRDEDRRRGISRG